MNQMPPTEPLGAGAPPRTQAQRTSRSPFYLTVGCASVVLGLVLGIGGFFGVRAVTDGEATEPTATSPTQGETFKTAPVGRDAAIALGTTFPHASPDKFPGDAEIALTETDWDATEEIAAANEFNPAPPSGAKYIRVTAEATYHGEGALSPLDWIGVQYVDPDGGEHFRTYVVTETDADLPAEVADGEGFQDSFVFQIPEDTPAGGHIVVLPDLMHGLDEGTWVELA